MKRKIIAARCAFMHILVTILVQMLMLLTNVEVVESDETGHVTRS